MKKKINRKIIYNIFGNESWLRIAKTESKLFEHFTMLISTFGQNIKLLRLFILV